MLSESVSKALQLVGGDEVAETSKFVGMIDTFFDILNIHNYTHGVHARKPFQMPHTTRQTTQGNSCCIMFFSLLSFIYTLQWLEDEFCPT